LKCFNYDSCDSDAEEKYGFCEECIKRILEEFRNDIRRIRNDKMQYYCKSCDWHIEYSKAEQDKVVGTNCPVCNDIINHERSVRYITKGFPSDSETAKLTVKFMKGNSFLIKGLIAVWMHRRKYPNTAITKREADDLYMIILKEIIPEMMFFINKEKDSHENNKKSD